MEMADRDTAKELHADLRTAWHRYVDLLAPLRPDLYGYCRRLAGYLHANYALAERIQKPTYSMLLLRRR